MSENSKLTKALWCTMVNSQQQAAPGIAITSVSPLKSQVFSLCKVILQGESQLFLRGSDTARIGSSVPSDGCLGYRRGHIPSSWSSGHGVGLLGRAGDGEVGASSSNVWRGTSGQVSQAEAAGSAALHSPGPCVPVNNNDKICNSCRIVTSPICVLSNPRTLPLISISSLA